MTDANSLAKIFSNMSYNSEQPIANLGNIKKWLLETHKGTLLSTMRGKSMKGDEKLIVPAFGEQIGVELIQRKETFSNQFEATIKQGTKVFGFQTTPEYISKLQGLLKSKSQDLINLESFAGGVPAWTVKLHDEPKWVAATKSSTTKQISGKLCPTSNLVFMITLDKATYCLENIIKILTAAIRVDTGTVTFILSLKQPQHVELVFPVLYLIEAVISARQPNPGPLFQISVLLAGDKLPQSEILKTLENYPDAKVFTVGPELFDIPQLSYLSGAVDFTRKDGESVHFVITDNADIDSAVSSISRNAWNCGIILNHRCRPLLFVHQSLYDSVIDSLVKSVEGIDLASYQTCKGEKVTPTIVRDSGTATDLVSMKTPGKGHVLVAIPFRSVAELVSLANNLGHTHETFLYCSSVSLTSEISNKLQTERLVLNDQEVKGGRVVDLSFTKVVIVKSQKQETMREETKESNKFKPGAIKEWHSYTDCEKSKRLAKFLGLGDSLSDYFTKLYLSEQIKASGSISSSRLAGIVSVNPSFPTDGLKFAIAACILKGSQTIVVCPDELALELQAEVKEMFPDGVVTVVQLESTDVTAASLNWELTWIISGDGDGNAVESELISQSKWNKTLIINDTLADVMEYGAAILKQNLKRV